MVLLPPLAPPYKGGGVSGGDGCLLITARDDGGGKRVDVRNLAGNRFLVFLRYENEEQSWPDVVALLVVLPALFRLSFSRS